MSKLKYFDGTTWKVVNGEVTGDTLPIGGIIPYGSSTAPSNWLVCDGSAVSRTDYSELFAVIGTSYGAGDGSTTFNLPNLKGRVAVGQDTTQTEFDTMGETGGSKYLQAHTHSITKYWGNPGTSYGYTDVFHYSASKTSSALSQSSGDVSNNVQTGTSGNLQPYIVTCYIIKAKQSAGVIANVSGAYSESETDTYSCDYINGAIKSIYSTTEQIIGDYLGTPLYRKVIQLTVSEYNALEATSGRRKLPIETLSVDRLLRADLNVKYNDGTKVSKKSYPSHSVGSNSGSYEIGINDIEDDNLLIVIGSSVLNGLTDNINIILEYTKTTD